jgi:lipopolysaccharide transport system ATP-binding protein
MRETVIRVEGLGKRYRIRSSGGAPYTTFREAITKAAAAPFRIACGKQPSSHDKYADFWALADVGFDVMRGDVLGVIGRNGAGKSTLLKVLSRITEPTTGSVSLVGRVGSLLEVGTGFHPELTGRENIFLNGALLGMRRAEVRSKFDAIVAFSEVENFLDTPVKHYSSGMYTRLAFSVAAHLEPEILIVDEVLAVGDAAFQQKCLGKMRDISSQGRTVLFVSHNMAAIETLCTRCMVLSKGRVSFLGNNLEGIRHYFSESPAAHSRFRYDPPPGALGKPHIQEVTVESNGIFSESGYAINAPLEFRVICVLPRPLFHPTLGIGINDSNGHRVTTLHSKHAPAFSLPTGVTGTFEAICRIHDLPLTPGSYRIKVSLEDGNASMHTIEDALDLVILSTDFFGNAGYYGSGNVLCPQAWEVQAMDASAKHMAGGGR